MVCMGSSSSLAAAPWHFKVISKEVFKTLISPWMKQRRGTQPEVCSRESRGIAGAVLPRTLREGYLQGIQKSAAKYQHCNKMQSALDATYLPPAQVWRSPRPHIPHTTCSPERRAWFTSTGCCLPSRRPPFGCAKGV